jgi:hypothetical protein
MIVKAVSHSCARPYLSFGRPPIPRSERKNGLQRRTPVARRAQGDGDSPASPVSEKAFDKTKLMDQIKSFGVAGTLSYVVTELAFWAIALPGAWIGEHVPNAMGTPCRAVSLPGASVHQSCTPHPGHEPPRRRSVACCHAAGMQPYTSHTPHPCPAELEQTKTYGQQPGKLSKL